jgi:hypothetical protein
MGAALDAGFLDLSPLTHWYRHFPPWINPHRCARLAGVQVASVGNFSQIQVFSQDPRMIVVFAYLFVQPSGGTINVFDSGGPISGTVVGNPAAVVQGDTPPGVNMLSNTPAAAPGTNWTIGVGANASTVWLPPFAFSVIQKGNGLTFTTNVVNQAIQGGVMIAAIEPDELPIQFR